MKVGSFRARDLLGGRTSFSAIHRCASRAIKDRLLVTELTVMCQGTWVGRGVHLAKKFHTENPGPFLGPSTTVRLCLWVLSTAHPFSLYSTLTGFEPGLRLCLTQVGALRVSQLCPK